MQYLINLTGIWLLSLAIYNLLLRRESYHAYNRAFLLITLVAGVILPLWQWHGVNEVPQMVKASLDEVVVVKQALTTTAADKLNWQWWTKAAYIGGVIIGISSLLYDILKLVKYYKLGSKSAGDGWTIIETGKEHAPFSIFNLLFVSTRDEYSETEWQMIVDHERLHTKYLHSADLALIQLTRILFWFHPLVYLFSKQLLLVHEYQADKVAKPQPQEYGKFLVEQAILHAAPSVTHSFNRSPIKKRIIMLTKQSGAAAKIKMLVIAPLAVTCSLFFTKDAMAQQKKQKDVFTYVEQMPAAGYDISDYLSHNIHYPDSARKNGIEGRVIVKFVVGATGEISDAVVIRGVGGGLDEEALAVVQKMPPWKNPGKQNGKPVNVYFNLPIQFALKD